MSDILIVGCVLILSICINIILYDKYRHEHYFTSQWQYLYEIKKEQFKNLTKSK